MMKQKKRFKFYLYLFGTLIAGLLLNGCSSGQTVEPAQIGDTVTAKIGDLSASIGSTGRLIAPQTANLSASSSGTIQQINVAIGDQVNSDEILLELEQTDLQQAVDQAEQSLRLQEIHLLTLQTPPTAAALAAAQAAVDSAQAQLDQLLASPTSTQLDAAEANLRAAEASVWAASSNLQAAQTGSAVADVQTARTALANAQNTFNQAHDNYVHMADCKVPAGETAHVCMLDMSNADAASVQWEVTAAKARLDEAQATLDRLQKGDFNGSRIAQASLAAAVARKDASVANLELLKAGPKASDIAAAESSLAQAQSNLATLVAGSKPETIAIAEAQVAQARISLQQAEFNLAQATLKAPFSGIVTAISAHPGEQAAGTLISVADLSSMVLRLNVNELDLAQLSIGQQASVVMESWPDVNFSAEIIRISPENQARSDNQPVRYSVHLKLIDSNHTDQPLRVGMSGVANIILSEKKNALLLPSHAITFNSETGQASVNVVQGSGEQETLTKVDVETGSTNGQMTEIISGLKAGDRVRILVAPPPTINIDDDIGSEEEF